MVFFEACVIGLQHLYRRLPQAACGQKYADFMSEEVVMKFF